MNEIKLRALEPEDLDVLYDIENDRSLWNVGCTNVPYSRNVIRDFIQNATNDIYTDKQLRLMVELSDGTIVGIADMVNFDPRHLRAEVGIVIKHGFRRQGYAAAALHLLQNYARNILHLHQLYAVIELSNEGSLCLFERAGFRRVAVLDDWLQAADGYHKAVFMQYFL